MPDNETTEKAKEDLREGKSPSTAAGEFVHEEIDHVREGKHGARSPQQAIAIGLSKARRAGIPVIGVEFGYTEVPIADLKPDRLIGHMSELPAAVETLMLHRNIS